MSYSTRHCRGRGSVKEPDQSNNLKEGAHAMWPRAEPRVNNHITRRTKGQAPGRASPTPCESSFDGALCLDYGRTMGQRAPCKTRSARKLPTDIAS